MKRTLQNMFKNSFVISLVLWITTILVFLLLHLFFANENLFDNSLKINFFFLSLVYGFGAFWSVYLLRKSTSFISFKNAFSKAFHPIFWAGLFSIVFMAFYLNQINPTSKNLLNQQFIQRQNMELDQKYNNAKSSMKTQEEIQELTVEYQQAKEGIEVQKKSGLDMFSYSKFGIYFAIISLFYIILSFFLASFFRTKNTF